MLKIVLFIFLFSLDSWALKVYSPAKNSPLRAELLNVIRQQVEAQYGAKVLFNVRALYTEEGSSQNALLFVVPVSDKGEGLNLKGKKLSGWVFALLKKEGDRWVSREIEFNDSEGKVLDAWMKKYPEVPELLFQAVGIFTNTEEA